MKLSLKTIGRTILQLKVETHDCILETDVTNLHSYVDEELINSLREIADQLEEHNKKQKEKDE